jgi:uncharacterized protein YvpB
MSFILKIIPLATLIINRYNGFMKPPSTRTLILLLLAGILLLPAAVPLDGGLPEVFFIKDISGRGQAFPLSCESRSATDLARFWGVKFSETTFFSSLPTSDNPEKGFVGSVFGHWGQIPPKPYGVHARPVALALRKFGLNARAHYGMTLEELKFEIANGRPVVVWVVGRVWKGTPINYNAKDGSEVTVARYEHTMLAYGYDKAGIYLIDAGSGTRKNYSYKNFTASWGVLGNMAVTAKGLIPYVHEYPLDR